MDVSCSDTALRSLKQIAARSPAAYVEIGTMIKAIRQSGLAGEMGIAVLNNRYDVYLLEPASPGVPVLLVADPAMSDRCMLADAGPFSAASEQQKRHAAIAAAAAMSIVLTDIHIVP